MIRFFFISNFLKTPVVNQLNLPFLAILVLLHLSCTKESLAPSTVSQAENAQEKQVVEYGKCASSALPPLDLLVLYDNSTSITYSQIDFRQAIADLLRDIGGDQDIRLCVQRLISIPNESNICEYFTATQGSSSVQLPRTEFTQIGSWSSTLNLNVVNTSKEFGIDRVYQLFKSGMGTVFRSGAYAAAVIVSNGDDTGVCSDGMGNSSDCYSQQYLQAFMQLKKQFSLQQIRFFSVVNSTHQCGSVSRVPGQRYRQFSRLIATAQGINATDSYDLCDKKPKDFFNKIVTDMNNFRVSFKYQYWPLGDMTNIDPKQLKIFNSENGKEISSSLYQYVAETNERNLLWPGIGSDQTFSEVARGPFIRLLNPDLIKWPHCLVVQKSAFAKYYGHVVLKDKPRPDSLVVYKQGKKMLGLGPSVGSNETGWRYEGFKESQLLLIASPADRSIPNFSAQELDSYRRTGYVIALYGDATYTDGEKLEVYFKKAPID